LRDVTEATVAHYNLLDRIGEGGLGEVYRARDTKYGRTVALKLSAAGALVDEARREQFLEDARAAATLSHPNIATLFDVGQHEGGYYLAYEYVPGIPLKQQIGGRAMNVRHALELAVQIADALADAHSQGIIHTDLRPDNIVITGKGSSKILDFGMAAWTRGGSARARAAERPDPLDAEVAAVAPYVSPEQALGGGVDARSDVFSLGVIVYEMLTGRPPFAAGTAPDTLMRISTGRAAAPSSINPELPKELDTVLMRALAKGLDERQQTAVAFAAELRSIAAVLDVRTGDAAAPVDLLPLDEDEGTRGMWVVLGALALIVGALVWFFYFR
jgi:serine/threonine-protein kinase